MAAALFTFEVELPRFTEKKTPQISEDRAKTGIYAFKESVRD